MSHDNNMAAAYQREGRAHKRRDAAYQSVIERLKRHEIDQAEAVRALRAAYQRAHRARSAT